MPQILKYWLPTSFNDTSQQPVQSTPTVEKCNDNWCGSWNTKQEALNSLFSLYKLKSGKIVRWFIDWEGFLRWFEVGPRASKEIIFADDERVTNFTVKEDATNIINYITGGYGSGDTAGTVTVSDSTSIGIYGKCVDNSNISKPCMTQAQLTTYLNAEIARTCVPIYTATLEMAGFYDIEPGKQINFPDDPYYPTKDFTLVDWTFTPNPPKTVLNLTTDESVISMPNEFEVIQSTAMATVESVLPQVGVVTATPTDTGRAIVALENGKGTVNTRTLGQRLVW